MNKDKWYVYINHTRIMNNKYLRMPFLESMILKQNVSMYRCQRRAPRKKQRRQSWYKQHQKVMILILKIFAPSAWWLDEYLKWELSPKNIEQMMRNKRVRLWIYGTKESSHEYTERKSPTMNIRNERVRQWIYGTKESGHEYTKQKSPAMNIRNGRVLSQW